MENGFIFEHAAAGWLVWLALASAVAATAWSAWAHLRRERSWPWLLALRLAFLALLGWAMLLPSRRAAITEMVRPRFLVLLDTSASMLRGTEDGLAESNRWQNAMALLDGDWARHVSAGCDISLTGFDAGLSEATAHGKRAAFEPTGQSTRLRAALDALFARHRGQDIAGVLLLSDGIDTSEPDNTWISDRSWPAPIHTAILGEVARQERKADVRIEAIDTPRRAVVGWDTRLSATVAGVVPGGEPFVVRLLRDGEQVEEVPAQLPAEGGRQELSFKLPHPDIGVETWQAVIPPLEGEAQTNDNAMSAVVEVVDARNRLLYIEDVPRWESKYLNRELLSNKDITPLSFVRGPGGKFISYTQAGGASLDLTAEQLALYKIVVLGDLDAAALGPDRAEALRGFVERGGGLILLGGPKTLGSGGLASTALSALMPFTRPATPPSEGKFDARWSADGRGHPALAGAGDVPESVPPVLSLFGDAALGDASITLAEANAPSGWQPLVVTRPYGQGKVVALLTDSLWRWSLEPGTREAYSFLWKRIVEWLSPEASDADGNAIELFSAAGRVDVGEEFEVTARVTMADGGNPPPGLRVTCDMDMPDGRQVALAMETAVVNAAGRDFTGFRARFTPQAEGPYRAVARTEIDGVAIESAPLVFQAREAAREDAPIPLDIDCLRSLSRASGGRSGTPDEIDAFLRASRFEPRRETRVEYESLWQKPLVLSILLLLLLAEWITRKMRGLS